MEERFKVFSESHNKMLDLVEMVDPSLAKKYQKVISKMPNYVLNKLQDKKAFSCDGTDYRIDFDNYEEMIEFQYTTYKKYFNVSMNLYPYYDYELLEEDFDEDEENLYIDPEIADDEDGNLFIFSLTMTNTEDEAKIKINFEEQNGEYKYINTETKGIELDYSVFVERRENDEFFLISKQIVNGVEFSRKEMPISYEKLLAYASQDEIVDDEYEEYHEPFDFDDLSDAEPYIEDSEEDDFTTNL